jgi:hypothetical protein
MGMGSQFDDPGDLSPDHTLAIVCGDLNCSDGDVTATVTVTLAQGGTYGTDSKTFSCRSPNGEWMHEVRARLRKDKPGPGPKRQQWVEEWDQAVWQPGEVVGNGIITYHRNDGTSQPPFHWGPQKFDLDG